MSLRPSYRYSMTPRSTCEICGKDYPPAKVRTLKLPEWAVPGFTRFWTQSMCPDCAMFYTEKWRFIVT